MARLLVNDEWFDSVSPESLYESEFEDLLLEKAETLYPTFHAVRFNALVNSDRGPKRADLALIDRQYRDWWVVEIELSNHPLKSHVEDQVAGLSSGSYGLAEAKHLCARSKALDRAAVIEMMRGAQPRVLVIVNQSMPVWSNTLARYGAVVSVAEVFRSNRNRTILRINGDHPVPIGNIVSKCEREPSTPFLTVNSPAALKVRPKGKVTIWFEGGVTEWLRCDSATKVWLIPSGRNPLPDGSRYFVLSRSDEGHLVLEARKPPLVGRE